MKLRTGATHELIVRRIFPKRQVEGHTAHILVNAPQFAFWGMFTVMFLLSGLFGSIYYYFRASPWALLALPLVLLRHVPIDRVLAGTVLLTAVVLLSGAVNNIPPIMALLFLKGAVFTYLVYRASEFGVHRDNAALVVRACVWIAAIQIPVIALQRALYSSLPLVVARPSTLFVDVGRGTFRGDEVLGAFLNLLLVFLLFGPNAKHFVKRRWVVALVVIGTILYANSQMSKLIMVLVLSVYALRHIRSAKTVLASILVLAVLSYAVGTGLLRKQVDNYLIWQIEQHVQALSHAPTKKEFRLFLTGGYSRSAALWTFLNEDIRVIGHGPNKFSNPIEKTLSRGATGHHFTYYQDVGLAGWILSLLIIWAIAFPVRGAPVRLASVLALVVMLAQGYTTNIFDNASIGLAYAMFCRLFVVTSHFGGTETGYDSGNPVASTAEAG